MRKYLVGCLVGAALVAAPWAFHGEAGAATVVTGRCRAAVLVDGLPRYVTKPDAFCVSELVYAPPPSPLPTPCPLPGVPCAGRANLKGQ